MKVLNTAEGSLVVGGGSAVVEYGVLFTQIGLAAFAADAVALGAFALFNGVRARQVPRAIWTGVRTAGFAAALAKSYAVTLAGAVAYVIVSNLGSANGDGGVN